MDNRRLEMLVFGAHADFTPNKLTPTLEALYAGRGPTGIARVGAVSALRDFVRSDDRLVWPSAFDGLIKGVLQWLGENGQDGPGSGSGWNDYFLGRWMVCGNLADLAELVRRAKHRDGSTSTLGTSGDAVTLLSAGFGRDVELRRKLRGLAFDPATLKFGNHPPGSSTAFVIVIPAARAAAGRSVRSPQGAARSPIARPKPVDAAAAFAKVPLSETVASVHGAGDVPAGASLAPLAESGGTTRLEMTATAIAETADMPVSVDETAGTVKVGDFSLSITRAWSLHKALVTSIRSLVIPAEGFAWVDSMADPEAFSALVLFDSQLRPGLPDFTGTGALQPPPGQNWKLQAQVAQDPDTAFYSAKLFDTKGEYSTLPKQFADMNQAKHAVASAVRALLK